MRSDTTGGVKPYKSKATTYVRNKYHEDYKPSQDPDEIEELPENYYSTDGDYVTRI